MAKYTGDVTVATYVDLPSSVCQRSAGLGIDVGTSLIKVAYREKKSGARVGEPPVGRGKERIRLLLCTPADINNVLVDLSRSAHVSHDQLVYLTGLKSKHFATEIEEGLKIKTTILPNTESCLNGFRFILDHCTITEALSPALSESIKEGMDVLEEKEKLFAAMNEHLEIKMDKYAKDAGRQRHAQQVSVFPSDVTGDVAYSHVTNDLFPCLLLCLGSTAEALKVSAEGHVEVIGQSGRCGGSCMGLAHLITGVQGYTDVMRLAASGADRELCTYSTDLLDMEAENDSYVEFGKSDSMAFMYGKAVDKDRGSFSKEGLSKTLVLQYATDLAHLAYTSAALADLSRVFIAGNMCNADVMRGELSKNIVLKGLYRLTKRPVEYQFLRHGGFLGAIGALIANENGLATTDAE